MAANKTMAENKRKAENKIHPARSQIAKKEDFVNILESGHSRNPVVEKQR